jgi:hypothetical protein
MSALAAAARATDVAVFYEMQDVAIACDHVPLQSGTAMVAVEASPDVHDPPWPGVRAHVVFLRGIH